VFTVRYHGCDIRIKKAKEFAQIISQSISLDEQRI
jgi:hypothetical protein